MALPERRGYRYAADFNTDGRADMDALAPAPRRSAWRLIRELQTNPYRAGTKQLLGQPDGTRRAVLGGRRMIYSVNQPTRTITIQRIDLRADIYTGNFARRGPP